MSRTKHTYRLRLLGVGQSFALLLLVLTLPVAQQVAAAPLSVRDLTYSVEPIIQGESSHLRVSLTFKGDASGKARLLLPSNWSDGEDLYKNIKNLKAESEDTKIEDDKEPHVRIVHHRPYQRISLTYDVVSQPPGAQLNVAAYHNPVVRSSYLYVIGQALWVYPEMPGDTPLRVNLHWKNIPKGWALINSFGISEPRQKVKTTLHKFRAGTFLAGDYRIKRFVIKKRPVYAVTRGEWLFPDEKLNSLVQKVVQVQRDFWNSYDFPYYFVAVLPSDQRNVTGGELRTNSFSLYLPKETTLSVGRDLYLLAHETFHAWNPLRLGDYENDRLYLFGEGFTDYYAFLLLLRSGLMSLDEYVAAHNSWIKAYYTSPVRSLTADEMVQKRGTSWDAGQLIYKKGYLLANHLDFTIRSKTNGKHSLDDVMRSLLRSSKPGINLSEKRIADALRPYLQEQGASDLEKYMNRGELVPADNSFGACATVEDIEHRSLDVGFDYKKSFQTRVVSGVVPGSNAHKAGLRDGQKMVIWNILDDPKSEAKVTIAEGATQKVLQYYPASTEVIRLPQFKLKSDLSAEDRAPCLSQLGVPTAAQEPRRDQSVAKPTLRKELLQRVEQDQAIRDELARKGVEHQDRSVLARMRAIDAANTKRMRAIIRKYGWPGPRLVGQDGADAAFVLVQHADLTFQKEMLPFVEKAYKQKELSGQRYALLLDRVLIGDGKPQVYGTQAKLKDKEFVPDPIVDELNVDKRRAKVGLPPLAEYLKVLKQAYFPQDKEQP